MGKSSLLEIIRNDLRSEEESVAFMRRIWTETITAGAGEDLEAIMMGHIDDLMAEVSTQSASGWTHPLLRMGANPRNSLNTFSGPVTDYTSSMIQWMRHRQPRYKGGARIDMERPSPSYIIDVCSPAEIEDRYCTHTNSNVWLL